MIKVIFRQKRISPVNLKSLIYYVDTDNYNAALEKAREVMIQEVKKDFLPYYKDGDAALVKINIIK